MHIQAEGITHFDIFHVFVDNSVNSELIRKVLIWTFWDYKSLWSKKPTPIQPQGVIGAPPTMYFQKMQILGVFRPFLQRSLGQHTNLCPLHIAVQIE